jgi:ABC-type antimicrobial peptide transport system permease subunit
MSKAIQQAIASVDLDQPVLLTASLGSLLTDSIADRRFIITLLGTTGGLALLIALAGIYGVMSYTTSRRTQEIGLRMAVGATPARIHALLFRQGFLTVLAGLAIGFGCVVVVVRALRGVIAGLGPENISGMWIAGFVVLLTTALACWLPASRATKSDPISALRQD